MSEEVKFLNGHTIMLIQFSKNEETRTFIDCKTPDEIFESFCRIYENFLLNKCGHLDPETAEIAPQKMEYQLDDLIKFVDQLFDLSALAYNEKAAGYTAHGKAWFKGMLHAYLRKQVVQE